MAYLHEVPDEQAAGLLREQYDQDLKKDGYVNRSTSIFSRRPDVYAFWPQMVRQLRTHMSLRNYELVTLAAARAIDCKY